MKLTTVISSVNSNPDYYNFLPYQILFWNKFNIKFICVYVGQSIPSELEQYKEHIILWDKNQDLHSAYVAQNIRIFYASLINLPDDECIMLTDMDMLPCDDKYYKDNLEHFTKEDFIYYRYIDAVDKHVYLCYNAAHPTLWGEIFGIKSVEDIENQLNLNYVKGYNGIPGDHNGSVGWCADQDLLTSKLTQYKKFHILNKPIKRLEVRDYIKYLQSGNNNFLHLYDDVHFHRSFSANKQFIEHAVTQLTTKIFYSQQGEDIFIYRNFINLKRSDGIFVELGGVDGITYSNTKFFEDELNFKGVLIEPTKQYDKMIINRPKCDNYNLAVSYNKEKIKFLGDGATAGASDLMTENFKKSWHKQSYEYYVDGMPFCKILEKSNIKYIDLLSIDVEGGELMVMETMNWNIPVYVVLIELDNHNSDKDEKCREILRSNGFKFYNKMCINEFWINPNYFRKDLLWDNTIINDNFSSIYELGKFVFLERHVVWEVEQSLRKYYKKNLISGYEFYKLAKWSVCPRYPIKFDPNLIQLNDIVFLNFDCFGQFVQILNQNPPQNKFILLTHNSDQKFTYQHLNQIKPYITHVYAINCEFQDPLVTPIPLGFVDSKYKPHDKFEEIANKKLEKTIQCYMNFAINTNPVKRQECWNTFVNQDWVVQESNISPEEFYTQVARSKYILSPEGTGIDCHRIYESIYLGSIPILKTSELDYFYQSLPVLIVKSWEEITQEYLDNNYLNLKNKLDQWILTNPTWTDAKFWIREKNTCELCGYLCGNLKCGKCGSVYYCNRSCQVAGWPSHKNECKKI
jgi:hypothetical protein